MRDEPKSALRQAILKSLPILRDLVGRYSEPYLVWSKRGDGQWHGEYQQRPNLRQAYVAAEKQLDEAAAEFARLFFATHPEYDGMVGSRRFGLIRFNKSHMLRNATGAIWDKYGTFDCDEACVDAIVEEFAEFVDCPTFRVRFQAQLLNYRMTTSRVALSENLTIRRLGEQEVSRFHGGPASSLGFLRPRTSGIHEFVIEGEDEEPKVLGDLAPDARSAPDNVEARLDSAILCLRTFKEGHVGYDYVHFRPVKFCPLPLWSIGSGDLYVPRGSYQICDDEVRPLCEHAKLVFALSEPAMEMACRRLGDAATRTRAEDRIVDAVIGMEALLLAGLDDRRAELRYRFSLNYSTLFTTAEDRYRAFRVAKDLYDLRSKIAHGSSFKDTTFRVGDEKLNLTHAAKRATETLRLVIRRFLPHTQAAPYKRHEFWEQGYFGLVEAEND